MRVGGRHASLSPRFHDNRPKTSAKDTQARIVKCAAVAFAQHGFRAATMREIASAAAVNEITVYRHFPRKQDLYWEAVDWKLRSSGIADALKQALIEGEDLPHLLQNLSEVVMHIAQQDKTFGRLMYFTALELKGEKTRVFDVHVKPLLNLLTERIQRWVSAGDLRAVDPHSAALALAGVMLSQCNLNGLLSDVGYSNRSTEVLSKEFMDMIALGLSVGSQRR